eukprot:30960-Pelagococcus_subviridis.AAC.6
MLNTGTLPKKFENFSALSVAEVTMSRKSLRRATTFFKIPKSTSVCSDRSCASSMITQLYASRSDSRSVSLSNTPSVMYLITVSGPVQSSNRIAYPTFPPSSQPSSSLTLFATDIAATLRGCVHPIIPNVEYPSSCIPGLADDDDDVVLANGQHQVLSRAEHGEKFALLLHRLRLREITARDALVLHAVRELAPRPEVDLAVLVELHLVVRVLQALPGLLAHPFRVRRGFLVLLLRRPGHVPHLRALHLPKPIPRLVLVALLPNLAHERAAPARDHRHVRRRVLHRQNHIRLLREHRAAVQKRRLRVVHEQHHAVLLLRLEVEVNLAETHDPGGDQPVLLPRVVVGVYARHFFRLRERHRATISPRQALGVLLLFLLHPVLGLRPRERVVRVAVPAAALVVVVPRAVEVLLVGAGGGAAAVGHGAEDAALAEVVVDDADAGGAAAAAASAAFFVVVHPRVGFPRRGAEGGAFELERRAVRGRGRVRAARGPRPVGPAAAAAAAVPRAA